MPRYDPLAWAKRPGFDNGFAALGWLPYRQNVIDWTLRLKPESILDVGCCRGHYLSRLREKGFGGRLVGLDVAPEFVAEVVAHGHEGVVGDCRAMPFSDGEFDTTICVDVLRHLPNPATTLAEVCRVTARRLVLTCGGAYGDVETRHGSRLLSYYYPKEILRGFLPPGWRLDKFAEHTGPHGRLIFLYRFGRRR